MLVALGERDKFVQHAVLGPSHNRNKFAHADAAGQFLHRAHAPVGIPIHHFLLVHSAGPETADFNAWGERILAFTLFGVGTIDAAFIAKEDHARARRDL